MSITFPTKHDEAWRYTNVNALVEAVQGAPHAIAGTKPVALAFAEGPFVALNKSRTTDGHVIRVPRGKREEIELVFNDDALTDPRVVIVLEDGAEASVIERHVGSGATNAVTEIVVGRDASLRYTLWQAKPVDARHVQTVAAQVRGRMTAHALSFGAALSRIELHAELFAHAELDAFGLMLGRGAQHQDNRTVITHAEAHARSRQLWKSLLDERATAVFDGLIRVRKDAQKTDAGQQNKNLLLSKDAGVTSKPHLEIYADDVKCAHGSTTGQLDEDAVFYLRARGIDERTARAMLAEGFAREVAEGAGDAAVTALMKWLHGGAA